MVGDRTDEGRFYVACGQGLVRITNAFSGTLGFSKLSGANGLPAGGVAGKPYVSADGQTIIVGLGAGIYRTTNGGASWSRVGSESGFAKLQVNPYDPSHMILIYDQQSAQQRPKYSTDGGASFTETAAADVERRPGLSYTPMMMYNFAHVAFHSTPGHAWLCGRQTSLPAAANHYRTTDYGAHWSLSTEGFNGSNFANRGVSPFMFSPTDKNRFALSLPRQRDLADQQRRPVLHPVDLHQRADRPGEADRLRGLAASGRGAADAVRRGRDRQLLRHGALARRRGELGPAARHRHHLRTAT